MKKVFCARLWYKHVATTGRIAPASSLTMHFSFGQELRQEQKQILTQRMIQAMEILQLTNLQLEERIDQELEKNPLLELNTEPSENDSETEDDKTDEAPPNFEFEPITSIGATADAREDFQTADDFAQAYSDTIDELPARSQNWIEEDAERRHDAFANIPSPEQTLQDYLIEQLGWFDLSPELREMTERIINNLDDNGYFTMSWEEFLGPKRSDNDQQLATEAIRITRRLDPPGVGATNLQDCLTLQLSTEIPHQDVVHRLILDHLEDVRSNRLPVIVKATGFSLPVVQAAIAELRQLHPRPGAAFAAKAAPSVMPDLAVEKNDDEKYIVRILEGRSQNLTINDDYRNLARKKETDKETRNYLKRNIGSAQWLIEAIEQRRQTLTKVGQAIIDHQLDFFEIGPHALKPLKMQQIADQVGVHVTTVSRACDEKWMLTPQGIYPLKRFFSGAIASSDGGETVAQDTVMLKLREIIDKEDKAKPFSDDELVRKLEAVGIKIARRTVVKYRQNMSIPSSRERKDWN